MFHGEFEFIFTWLQWTYVQPGPWSTVTVSYLNITSLCLFCKKSFYGFYDKLQNLKPLINRIQA